MLLSRLVVSIFAVGLMGIGAGVVSGQDYPSKPIRIVTASVGGGDDFDSRLIAQGISGPLGRPVIVENRAGSYTASDTVAKAAPDGYTVLVHGASTWILPLLQKVPYEMADFAPISLIERSYRVVVVHPSLPVKSIKELIALAKAKPGQLNYASGGVGGSTHLSAELFKSMAGVNIVFVPYKVNAAGMASVMAGETQVMFNSTVSVLGPVKAGKLRALAVTSAQPTALAPGLPTVAATGLPGYEAVSPEAMLAPAKTPESIIRRLYQETARFLNTPEVKEKLFNVGVEVVAGSPEELAALLKSETARWGKVIKEAGIKGE